MVATKMRLFTLKSLAVWAATALCLLASTANATNKSPGGGIAFEPNADRFKDVNGKARPELRFRARTGGASVYFQADKISYVFERFEKKDRNVTGVKWDRVDMRLAGVNPDARLWAEKPLDGTIAYYQGRNERQDIKRYGKIVYQNVYPLIDLEYYTDADGKLKYDFIVRPGGNPADIRLAFDGAQGVSLDPSGAFKVRTTLGGWEEQKPYIYQQKSQKQTAVNGRFALNGQTLGFEIDNYDKTRPLVIDPTLNFSTYFGGTDFEYIYGVATNPAGDTYVVGETYSASFPATTGPGFDNSLSGFIDGFVAKFTPAGALSWATFVGGSDDESTGGVTVAQDGNVYVAGYTTSTDFPVTSGAYQTNLRGGTNSDAYLMKLTPAGAVVWATYYGGTGSENFDSFFPGAGVTTDNNGNVVMVGVTSSTDLLVGAVTGFQSVFGGNPIDGFVAKFSSNGNKIWETYYGGNARDRLTGVAADQNGNIFITGGTGSTAGFPLQNPAGGAYFQSVKGTGTDGFIAKITENCTLAWSTYYGGNGEDNNLFWHGIGIDQTGAAFISGSTSSSNLPLATGSNSGSSDAFIAKFNNAGVHQWARYHGGTSGDDGHGLAVSADGKAVMVGFTLSETGFPQVGVPQFAFGSPGVTNDAYITQYNGAGTCLWSTYIGGDDYDEAFDVAIRPNGDIFVGGATISTNFPTLNALQGANNTNGGQKSFLMRFTDPVTPPCQGTPLTVTSTLTQPCGGLTNGAINLTVTGARPPMLYSWSNGAITQDLTNLAGGTYTVTITAEGGGGSCVFTQSYTLTDAGACPVPACNPAFAVNTSVTNPNGVCGGASPISLVGSVPVVTCNDYDVAVVTPAPTPLTGTATNLVLGDDELSSAIPIGFTFKHLCNNYTQLFIDSNGLIEFTNAGGSFFTNATIPNGAVPNDIIAFAWNDLDPTSGGTINFFTTGSAPSRKFVLNYINVPYFFSSNTLTVQVVLNETTNIIEINNINVQTPPNGMTQGIENATGSVGYVVTGRNDQVYSVTNELVTFTPRVAPVGPVTFQWSSASGPSLPAGPNASVTPSATTTYTLTVTDQGQNCAVTRTANVTVPGIRLDNVMQETCAGNNGAISTTITTGGTTCSTTAATGCTGISNPPVTVGGGVSNETVATPFRASPNTDVRYQSLYLASELTSAGVKPGKITALSIDVSGKTSTAGQFFANFTIKVGCTNAAALVANSYIAGTQTVFAAPAPGYATVSGINTITLDAPYVWDGTSNLVIEFCYDNTVAVNTDGVRVTGTGYISSIYDRQASGSGCSFTTAPNAFALRPNIGFTVCTSSIVWTPGGQTTDDITGLNGGAYTLTVNDYNGCNFTQNVTINEATPSVNLASAVPNAVCLNQTTVLTFNLVGTAPWTLSYKQNSNPPVTVSGITASPFVLTVTPTVTGVVTYTPVSISDAQGCPSATPTGATTVTVTQFPTASIASGAMTVCLGQSANLPLTLTGTAPWSVNYTTQMAGGPVIPNTLAGITATGTNLVFTPSQTGVYTVALTGVTDVGGCSNGAATGSMTITVVQGPQAFIGGTPPPLCQGQTGTVAVFLTGTAPWNFQISENGGPGIPYGPIPSTGGGFELITLTVTPTQFGTVTFTVSQVTDASGCASGATFGSVTINVTPVPTAMIGGSHPAICQGGSANFALLLSGTSPWNVKISENGGTPFSINGITTTLSLIPVTPTGTGPRTFTVADVTDATGCPGGMVSGTATVTVNAQPTAMLVSAPQTICQGASVSQTINLTGTAPWTLRYRVNNGPLITASGITASPFILNTTPSATGVLTYTLFDVTDASGCPGGMVSGSNIITVNAKPTATIGGTAVAICEGQTTTFAISLTGQAPWTIQYSQSGAPSVTVSGITASLYTITVTPSVTGVVTYTLTSVADANGCAGNAPTGSFVVTVKAKPTAMISGAAAAICQGLTANFTINLTGLGPWNIQYQESGGVTGTYNGIVSSPFILTVTPSSVGAKTYTLTSVMDANGCTGGAVSGSGTVTVKDSPTAMLSGTSPSLCFGQSTIFTVNLTGISPWTIRYSENSNPPVTISGITANPYILTVTPSTSGMRNYILTKVDDAGLCPGGTVMGNTSVMVNAVTAATATISGNPAAICQGGSVNFNVAIAGGTPPFSITYTENGSNPTTITGITTSNYTLTVTPTGSGLRQYALTALGQNNPCATTSVSGSASVTVNPNAVTTASLGAAALTACLGTPVTFNVNINGGTAPWTIQYRENSGAPITKSGITSSPYVLTVTPTGTGVRTFTLLSVTSSGPCTQHFASGTATVTVNPNQSASAVLSGPTQNICLGQTANLVVSLTGTAPWNIQYTENNGTPVTVTGILSSPFVLTVTPQSIGVRTYNLTSVSDAIGCGSPSTSGSVFVTVQTNSTAIASIAGNATICSGQTATITVNLGGTAPWTISYKQNNGAPITVSGISSSPFSLTVAPTQIGAYTYTLNSVTDASNCAGAGSGTIGGAALVVVSGGSSATIGGTPASICQGQSAQFTVALTGTAPWTIQYRENSGAPITVTGIQGTPYTLNVTPTGTGVRTYTLLSVTDGSSCGSGVVSGSGTVSVGAQLSLTLVSKNDVGCTGGTGSFTVAASGGAGSGFLYSIDGSNFNNNTGTFTGVLPGNYIVTAKDNSCQTTLLVTIIQPAVPTITSVSAITVNSATVSWTLTQGATSYVLGYKVVGASNYTFVNATTSPFTLTGLQSGTNYEVVVRARCASGTTSALSSAVPFTTLTNNATGCITPTNLSVVITSPTSATLTWQASPEGVCYIVSYGPINTNSSLWPQFLIPHPGNVLSLTGLAPNTQYGVIIRTNCSLCSVRSGVRTNFSSPVSFTTPNGAKMAAEAIAADNVTDVRVYPNPNRGVFSVSYDFNGESAQEVALKVTDVTGRIVQTLTRKAETGRNEYVLDLQNVASGVYFLHLETKASNRTIKVVVQ